MNKSLLGIHYQITVEFSIKRTIFLWRIMLCLSPNAYIDGFCIRFIFIHSPLKRKKSHSFKHPESCQLWGPQIAFIEEESLRLLGSDEGDNIILRKVCNYLPADMTSYCRRLVYLF